MRVASQGTIVRAHVANFLKVLSPILQYSELFIIREVILQCNIVWEAGESVAMATNSITSSYHDRVSEKQDYPPAHFTQLN